MLGLKGSRYAPGSNYVSDIQDYSEYIIKNYGRLTDNSSISIYVSKIENRITLELKESILSNF